MSSRCRSVLLLFLLAGLAGAETVHLEDGQVLQGELVEASRDELVLRTRYGVLVVPTAAVKRIEGLPGAAPEPAAAAPEAPPLDLQRTGVLHLKARRQAQLGRHEQALATWAELLEVDPEDPAAHLELGLLQARLGKSAEAVACLRRAILAGFTDLLRLRRDEALAAVRLEQAFTQLLDQQKGLLALAARRTPDRLLRELRARGAQARYQTVRDDARRLVWVHGLEEAAFAALRAEADALVDALRREPFTAEPKGALFVVLLPAQDRGVQTQPARYDPERNTLTLGPLPFGSLRRAPAARREVVRALHANEEQARQAPLPVWLGEGLAELLGDAALEGQGLALRPSALLPRLQKGLEKAAPWGGVMDLDRAGFAKQGRLAALAARSLLHWLADQDRLGAFYQEIASGAGLEAALGQPSGAAEKAWRAWVAAQSPPELPFTGLVTNPTAGGLRVGYVQADSGAAKADLMEGDLVVALNGAPLRTQDDLDEQLGACAVGEEVELELLRGEQPLRARVKLEARPPGPIGPLRDKAPYLGVAVEETTAAVQGGAGAQGGASGGGVSLRSVDEGSPAAKAGLKPGDRVHSFDGRPIESVRGWLRALRHKQPGQRATLVVQRGGEQLTCEVELIALPE